MYPFVKIFIMKSPLKQMDTWLTLIEYNGVCILLEKAQLAARGVKYWYKV